MSESIRLKRTVVGKDEFSKAVDSRFTTFVDPAAEEDTDTIEELFRLYSKLYYEIPVEGPNNSHEFLVRESSKLVKIEEVDESIQPLLEEINQLRTRLLQANQTIIELQVGSTTNG